MNWIQRKIRQSRWSKHSLRRIKGLSEAEINVLSTQLHDQDTLQQELDSYPGSMFHDLARRTNLTNAKLVESLLKSLDIWSRPSLVRCFGQHWADLVLLIVVGLLAIGVFFPPDRAYRVVAAREIPPFQQIQRDDLKVAPSTDDSREATAEYLGKYTVSSVHQGSALSSAVLSPGLASLRIEVKNSVVTDNATWPQLVTLVFSSRQAPQGGTAIPAMLLKIETSGSAQVATLQIASNQQSEATKWLGSADAYIILRAP